MKATFLGGSSWSRLPWLVGLLLATSTACQNPSAVRVDEPLRGVLGYGTAHFDADTGEVVFSATGPGGALLDGTDVLPNATAHNCETPGWNPGTLVLSVNAMLVNQSASTYLTPIELRLTGITEAGVVKSVNTDLINASCGANGLSVADDVSPANGRFDCILPDESDSENDPGWDFSSALGDGEFTPGEWSGCRFIHFNLISETNFNFSYQILGVVDDGWPPAPYVGSVTTPTAAPSQTVTGLCVVTTEAPDTGGPMATTDYVSILGAASPVHNIECVPQACQTPADGIERCGGFSTSVTLTANSNNHLELYQTLDGVDRGGSSYVNIVQDGTAPQVVGTQPANGALGVVPAVDILVTFSEVMDAATITAGNVFVREQGQGAEAATVTLAGSGTQAVINPDTDLADNTIYEIVVTTGVADLAGNNMLTQVVTSFTTAEGSTDTIPPTVTNIQPANGASNVDRRSEVVITFSEAIIDLGVGDILIEDVVRVQTVPGVYSLSPDRTAVTFVVAAGYDRTGPDTDGTGCVAAGAANPDTDFDCSSYYRVTVTTAIEDLSGNALPTNYVATFSTGIDPDTVPPTVDAFIPPPGAVNVSESIQPRVLFSEAVNAATVTTSTFFLKEDGVTLVPATVSVAGDGLSATLTPISLLSLSTRYVIFVNNGVQDLAGNALAAPANSDFHIATAPDTTAPFVVSVTPPDGADDVSRTTDVVIRFNEPLGPATVNTGTVLLDEMNWPTGVGVNQAVQGQVSLSSDGLLVTFAPFDDLRRRRDHRLTVTTGIRDLAGNPLASNFVATFTVEWDDNVAPCVTSISPGDGDVNVPENSHIGVGFTEPMNPSSVVESAFTLTGPGGAIAKSVSLSADGSQVLITPIGDLPVGSIDLTITDALEDDSVQLNALDQGSTAPGCLDPTGGAELTISFDVIGLADVTGPQVLAISPPDGAIGVSVAANVVITFDEPIDPLTATSSNILLLIDPSGNPQGVTRSFSSDLRVVTFDPTALLLGLTPYSVTIPTSVRDLAGNPLQHTVISYFTTSDSSLDTTPPNVVSTCPADDAGTPPDPSVDRMLVLGCNGSYPGKVVIVFDEPINSDTVHLGTFHLVEVINIIIVQLENDITDTVELLPGGTTVVITPQFSTGSGLRNATYHQIRISPTVTDNAGNPLNVVDNCALGTGDDCNDFDT